MGYCLSTLRYLNAEYYSGVFILWKPRQNFFPKQFAIMWNRCSPHSATAMRDEIEVSFCFEVSLTLFCVLSKACR